jgi:hypothetical protein
MAPVNPATDHASRTAKHPASIDFVARDLQKRLTSSDDYLIRRWERIAKEVRA